MKRWTVSRDMVAVGRSRWAATHQENAESASTKLKALGTVGVPYKRLEALSVLTVNPKRVKAHRIAAEYSFPSLACPVDTGFRRSG